MPQDIAISQKKSDDETPNANKDTSKKLGNKPSEKLSTESNVEQLSKPTVVNGMKADEEERRTCGSNVKMVIKDKKNEMCQKPTDANCKKSEEERRTCGSKVKIHVMKDEEDKMCTVKDKKTVTKVVLSKCNHGYNTQADGGKPLTVSDLEEAERALISYVQRKFFPEEMKTLQEIQMKKTEGQENNKRQADVKIRKASHLYKLNLLIEDGVIKVVGRLSKSPLSESMKHPAIIPKKSNIAELILRQIHEETGHGGRNHLLTQLHKKYWIVNGNAAARRIINSCVTCRERNAKVQQQMMVELLRDRVTPGEPPFTRVGMDYFGPLEIKQLRPQHCQEIRSSFRMPCLHSHPYRESRVFDYRRLHKCHKTFHF